jgi:hypothetical protein
MGKNFRIWKDKWIWSPSTYMVQSPTSILDPDATVSSLINRATNWWDDNLLNQVFSREEVQSIQSVPISLTGQEYALIWRGTANRVFSVKSAYHMLKEWEERNKAGGSSRGRTSTFWGQLWKLHIPNTEKQALLMAGVQ